MGDDNRHAKANHAWRYFELHANQRMSLIKYCIGMYSLYVTACGYLLFRDGSADSKEKGIVLLLSILVLILTWIFYLLDQRNRDLIHLAEDSLKNYEAEMSFQYPDNIFFREDREAKELSKFRHTHCFTALFLMGVLSALLISMYAIFVL